MKTIKQLAKDAEDVQNGCNLSGILHGAATAATELRAVLGPATSTGAVNRHPIMRAWAHKIADLAGLESYGYPAEELRLIHLAPDAPGDIPCTLPDCANCKTAAAVAAPSNADWTLGT